MSSSALEHAADLLRVVAHPVRLKLLELLYNEGPASVAELAHAVGEAPAATSQHLNYMRRAGAVAAVRQGRRVHYRIDDPRMEKLVRCICGATGNARKGGRS